MPREAFIENAARRFREKGVPLKVKKLELLKEIGLPVKEGRYYDRASIDALREDLIQQFDVDNEASFVIRVACEPDKLSMPSFRINVKSEIDSSLLALGRLIEDDRSIKQIILRPFISPGKIKNRIAGRLSFMGDSTTTQDILELYKGAETTGVFNTVDLQNRRFRSFIRKAGEFMKPSGLSIQKDEKDGEVSEEEIKNIHRQLELQREKMDVLHEVVAASKGSIPEKISLTFEFSYLNGEFWYTDFD